MGQVEYLTSLSIQMIYSFAIAMTGNMNDIHNCAPIVELCSLPYKQP